MRVRDAQIIRLIERIGDHYRTNISSRFIRPVLLQLAVDKQSWDLIEILTEKIDQYRYQGFELDELYRQIAAAARFVAQCRRELVPNLRSRISGLGSSGGEKVIQDMAVNTFAPNLQLFADLLYELYLALIELDKLDAKGRRPLYLQIPELAELNRLLKGA